jgi:hypothetical protein
MSEIKFQLSPTRTALSVVGFNKICDGDNFTEDGWVYNNGQKVRKWFVRLDADHEYRFWEPKFDNIKLLEQKRWKWLQRANKICMPLWKKIFNKCKKEKKLGGWVKFSEKAEGWVEITASETGISWNYVKKENIKHINQKLINEYFATEKRIETCYGRAKLFDIAFRKAVERQYMKKWEKESLESNIHLIINGRDYWLKKNDMPYGDFFIFVSLPEHTHHITERL